MIDKRNCTVETIGKVVKLLDKGIPVQYIVDNVLEELR